MARTWLRAGTVINYFEIRARVGASGLGEVYQARDTQHNRSVALKLLPLPPNWSSEHVQRLLQHLNNVRPPAHPNICELYEAGLTESGLIYLASAYFKGASLDALSMGRPETEVISVAIQIAEALQAALSQRIIHGDIKPQNLMLSQTGEVKVLDFVLAALRERWQPVSSANGPLSGLTLGRARYLSPERIRGEKLTPQSDLFSLGAVLYEMLTGQPPFDGRSVSEICDAILKQEPLPLTEYNPEVSKEVSAVIYKTLAKDPAQRYRTPEELLPHLKSLQQLAASRQKQKRKAGPSMMEQARAVTFEEFFSMFLSFGKGAFEISRYGRMLKMLTGMFKN
jgi:eukaryotic-like serine/threonine-protein kinase